MYDTICDKNILENIITPEYMNLALKKNQFSIKNC